MSGGGSGMAMEALAGNERLTEYGIFSTYRSMKTHRTSTPEIVRNFTIACKSLIFGRPNRPNVSYLTYYERLA